MTRRATLIRLIFFLYSIIAENQRVVVPLIAAAMLSIGARINQLKFVLQNRIYVYTNYLHLI